jgi:hypothetical protein
MKKKYIIIFILIFQIHIKAHNTENLNIIFTNIYNQNSWNNKESVSGPGSTLHRTGNLRKKFPEFLKKYDIKTLLDAPCGDFNWMKEIINNLSIKYIGIDIVSELININKSKFVNSSISFINADLIHYELPKVDLIFCRDCFIHLSKEDILKALKNFKSSGSKYLLMTHYRDNRLFIDIKAGDHRPLNFTLEPFNLPTPLEILDDNENYPQGLLDKCLALWKLEDINL